MAPRHTEETLHFMECKIAAHRHLLQSTFPDFLLKPKHHYLEHYPQLIRKFGPLPEVWAMHFEGKRKFFKGTIHNPQNFKKVAMTQTPESIRPSVEMTKVIPVLLASFSLNVQTVIAENITMQGSVLDVSSVSVDRIK